jgi:hypothetical protein
MKRLSACFSDFVKRGDQLGPIIKCSHESCIKVVNKSNLHFKTPSIVTHIRDYALYCDSESRWHHCLGNIFLGNIPRIGLNGMLYNYEPSRCIFLAPKAPSQQIDLNFPLSTDGYGTTGHILAVANSSEVHSSWDVHSSTLKLKAAVSFETYML